MHDSLYRKVQLVGVFVASLGAVIAALASWNPATIPILIGMLIYLSGLVGAWFDKE